MTLARFLKSVDVSVELLDEQLARACGELCRASGTEDVGVLHRATVPVVVVPAASGHA